MRVITLKSFAFQSVPELGVKNTNGFAIGERIDIPNGIAEKWVRAGLVQPVVETAMVAGGETATHVRPRKRRS